MKNECFFLFMFIVGMDINTMPDSRETKTTEHKQKQENFKVLYIIHMLKIQTK